VNVCLTASDAVTAENVCAMEVCESPSLTAVANKSLDLSRSLTEKIAAEVDDSDEENDAKRVVTPVSSNQQVVCTQQCVILEITVAQ